MEAGSGAQSYDIGRPSRRANAGGASFSVARSFLLACGCSPCPTTTKVCAAARAGARGGSAAGGAAASQDGASVRCGASPRATRCAPRLASGVRRAVLGLAPRCCVALAVRALNARLTRLLLPGASLAHEPTSTAAALTSNFGQPLVRV